MSIVEPLAPPNTLLPLPVLSETTSSYSAQPHFMSVTSHTQPPSSPTSPVLTPDDLTLASSLHTGSETASSHFSQPQSFKFHIPSPPSSPTSPVHTPNSDDLTLASSLQTGSQLFVTQPSTHAGRNSGGLLQASRSSNVTELSNAQKATKKVQQEAKRVQEVYFNEQFDIFLEK